MPGPGRPRRRTVHEIAVEKAAEDGFDLEAAVWRILRKLLLLAEAGDVAAAKLALQSICADPLEGFEDRLASLEERLLK